MEKREPQPDDETADVPRADPVARAMAQASQAATRGDFATAREALARTRDRVSPADRTRLDALDRSFHIDRAALVIIAVTAAVLVTISLSTLFH